MNLTTRVPNTSFIPYQFSMRRYQDFIAGKFTDGEVNGKPDWSKIAIAVYNIILY